MHIKNAFPYTEFEEKIQSHLPQCSEDTTGISVTAGGELLLIKQLNLHCATESYTFSSPPLMSLLLSFNYEDYIETHNGSVYT